MQSKAPLDEEDADRPPQPDDLERGQKNGKLGVRTGMPALNAVTLVILFVTARKPRAGLQLGLPLLILERKSRTEPQGVATGRALPHPLASLLRRTFLFNREKTGLKHL